MKDKFVNKSAYTLVELLVVLAIISILLTMSILTVTSFQQTAKLNEVNSIIFSKLKDFQSNAKANRFGINAQNNLNRDSPLTYNLDISGKNLKATICESNGLLRCSEYASGYDYEIDNENFILDQSKLKSCKLVSFKSNETNIILKSITNQVVSTCCLFIKNVKSNESRVIKVDSLSRSITSVEYDENDFCYN